MDYPTSVIIASMPVYVKKLADETTRNRLRLALLMKFGNIKYNVGGVRCIYPLLARLPASRGFSKATNPDYGDHNPLENLSLPWRAFYTSDSMHWLDTLANQPGDTQILDLFDLKMNNISKTLKRDMHVVSINAGDGILPDGLETFLAYNVCTTADKIATPNDTYGDTEKSLSTVLGALSGGVGWSTDLATSPNATLANDYPNGQGPEDYNANSPTFVNTNTLAWGTGDTTWETNCWRILTQAMSWHTKNGGDEGRPTNGVLGEDYWTGLKNNHETLRRIQIAGANREALELGFSDTLNFDGVPLHTEFDMPSGRAYLENMRHIEIACRTPEMFTIFQGGSQNEGPGPFESHMDLHDFRKKIWGGFVGQFRYRPRHVTRIADHTV